MPRELGPGMNRLGELRHAYEAEVARLVRLRNQGAPLAEVKAQEARVHAIEQEAAAVEVGSGIRKNEPQVRGLTA